MFLTHPSRLSLDDLVWACLCFSLRHWVPMLFSVGLWVSWLSQPSWIRRIARLQRYTKASISTHGLLKRLNTVHNILMPLDKASHMITSKVMRRKKMNKCSATISLLYGHKGWKEMQVQLPSLWQGYSLLMTGIQNKKITILRVYACRFE